MFTPTQVSTAGVKGRNPHGTSLETLTALNHTTWIRAKRELNLLPERPPLKPAGTLLSLSSSWVITQAETNAESTYRPEPSSPTDRLEKSLKRSI